MPNKIYTEKKNLALKITSKHLKEFGIKIYVYIFI